MSDIQDRHDSGGSGAGCGCLAVALLLAVVAVLLGRPFLTDDGDGGAQAAPEESVVATPTSERPRSKKPSGRRPGVVNIFTEQGLRGVRAAGTGIVVDPSGLVLTNNHVIQGATEIEGTDTDDRRTYPAQVLGYQKSGDIALIRLSGASGLKTAKFAEKWEVRLGDVVTAVGNAGGKGGTPSVVTGKVTALDRQITATDQSDGSSERLTGLIETNAPIKPGDSGGPLLNTSGQVIGMNTAASAGFDLEKKGASRGFAIPSAKALEIVRQIQRGEASDTVHIGRTALLGVQVRQPTTPSGGRAGGAYIADLIPGTPAEQAGLRARTTIVALDDEPVDSPGSLTDMLLRHHPGDTVRITWTNAAGERRTTPVTLGDGPPQ
ncbi:trypsin-like peptidase domain-containing protein [Spirillospora sp. NPDC047279]|uniref:S1C family serine protease n=1 Tax=Spirillospora sp. NPDC047279 TaxID=3155478 RepID=UPI0033D78BD5